MIAVRVLLGLETLQRVHSSLIELLWSAVHVRMSNG